MDDQGLHERPWPFMIGTEMPQSFARSDYGWDDRIPAEVQLVDENERKPVNERSRTSRADRVPPGYSPAARRVQGCCLRHIASGFAMSDRALWLDQWCPGVRVAPGSVADEALRRTRVACPAVSDVYGSSRRAVPLCRPEAASRTPDPRLRPGRHELLTSEPVWNELERRGAAIGSVVLSGRARSI
jgi:hypothetical protein